MRVTLSACVYQTGRQLSIYSFLIRDSFQEPLQPIPCLACPRYDTAYRSPVSEAPLEKLRPPLAKAEGCSRGATELRY